MTDLKTRITEEIESVQKEMEQAKHQIKHNTAQCEAQVQFWPFIALASPGIVIAGALLAPQKLVVVHPRQIPRVRLCQALRQVVMHPSWSGEYIRGIPTC